MLSNMPKRYVAIGFFPAKFLVLPQWPLSFELQSIPQGKRMSRLLSKLYSCVLIVYMRLQPFIVVCTQAGWKNAQ